MASLDMSWTHPVHRGKGLRLTVKLPFQLLLHAPPYRRLYRDTQGPTGSALERKGIHVPYNMREEIGL